MKALFFLLLAINIGYASWSLFISPQAPELRRALLEKRFDELTQAVPAESVPGLGNESAPGEQGIATDADNNSAASCWMLGPFEDESSARILQQRLLALEVELQLKTLTTPIASDYWVYIEPQMSRSAALRLLRELQGSQIDSFIIGEGELENGISLGFFPDERSARKLQRMRAEDGYAAKIKSVVRNAEEWWAVLEDDEYNKLEPGQWKKLQRELGKWQQRQNYCKLIASANELE